MASNVSDSLYLALAEALSRPSKRYQAAQEGLAIPGKAMAGYTEGAEFMDSIRKRKNAQMTLLEALGGTPIQGLEEFNNLATEQIKTIAPLAHFRRSSGDLSDFEKQRRMDERQARNQEAIAKRQRERHDFLRRMVGSKGNKDAVNQSKNAVQGLSYVDQLWDEIDKLSSLEKAGASNAITEKLFPTINTLKKNVRRTAGFSEGGKNLTENELEVVVESFEPTTLDDPSSRRLKKQIARDYYLGTIDLFEAANLLGPAGLKLKEIARNQQQRRGMVDSAVRAEALDSESDLDALFASEGVQ